MCLSLLKVLQSCLQTFRIRIKFVCCLLKLCNTVFNLVYLFQIGLQTLIYNGQINLHFRLNSYRKN